MGVGKLGLGALAAVGGAKAGKRVWDTLRQNRRVNAQQSELQTALQQASLLYQQVDCLQAEKAAALAELAETTSGLPDFPESQDHHQNEEALVAAITSQQDAERRLGIMLVRAKNHSKKAQIEERLKKELIKMQITSQMALSDAQSLVQQLQATVQECEAKMASDELSHAKQIKSWQTQMKAEEERAERMAGCLRTELEDKTQKLKQAQEAGSYRSKELVRSLVERYSQGLAHEEQIEELNNKWRRKEREWDLNAEDERRARQEAEARVATVEAQLRAFEGGKVAEAEKHAQEMRTLESTLNAAHAGKQVLEAQHEEVKGSLMAAEASKTAVLHKLKKQSSSFKESLKAQVEAETKDLASKVDQVKKEKTALQKSQVDLAEEYSTEKKEVKKEMKRLQAQLATSQKEKVDLADNHKVVVSALRENIHVLRAKQAPPNLAMDSPKKSKPAKKKAPASQNTASTNPPITMAEPSSSGKAINLLNISIPTPGPADGNAGVYNSMEAVPDSPGPSVAPPSPDAVERSSRRGWRGVDLSSQDDSAISASSNWDEREWQLVGSNNRGFQRAFSRSGGRHQHQA